MCIPWQHRPAVFARAFAAGCWAFLLCGHTLLATRVQVHSAYASGQASLVLLSRSPDSVCASLSFSGHTFGFELEARTAGWQTVLINQVNAAGTASSSAMLPVHSRFDRLILVQGRQADSLHIEAGADAAAHMQLIREHFQPFLHPPKQADAGALLAHALALREVDLSIILITQLLNRLDASHRHLIGLFIDYQRTRLGEAHPVLQVLEGQYPHWVRLVTGRVDNRFRVLGPGGEAVLFADLIPQQKPFYVWASWCEPCIRHIESLEDRSRYIYLSIDRSGKAWLDAVERLALDAEIYRDADGEVISRYNIQYIPQRFTVGDDGMVHWEDP